MTDESIGAGSYDAKAVPSTARLHLGVVGAGRAGTAIAREIAGSSLALEWLWDPVDRELPGDLGAVRFRSGGDAPPRDLLDLVDVVLLAVPDSRIAEAAARLQARPGTAVLHMSGALGTEVLADLPRGVSAGCYHPLQSFRSEPACPERHPAMPAPELPPYAVAIDGDAPALATARTIAAATGHRAVHVPAEHRAAWHAAGVLGSNCLVALLATATRALGLAGIDELDRWPLLRPLVLGTLSNAAGGDFGAALTGPISRGDAAVVERNLAALRSDLEAEAVYRALGRAALNLARDSLPAERARQVAALLDDGSRRQADESACVPRPKD